MPIGVYLRPTREEAFWKKVDKSGECWLWTAYRDKDGYGIFRTRRATHWALELAGQEVPPHTVVRHTCDNPPCVRVDHLRVGTNADNVADRQAKGRGQRGERQGHAKLTEEQIKRIKQLRAQGHPLYVLGYMFGVHLSTISKITTGVNWKHVA